MANIATSFMRMAAGLLLASAAALCAPSALGETLKVVIDAGHGGHDIGAPGSKTNEKTINLAVAKALAEELRALDEMVVVMTRNNDTFVPLKGRADIANRAGGDLFVSIHTNSIDRKAKNAKTVCGTSVYTLGLSRSDDNLAVAMRENSVMTLEPDYTTTYQGFDPNSAESYIIFEMDQNLHLDQSINAARYIQDRLVKKAKRRDRGVRQGPFSVLRNTSMPAVLVELDFICNPDMEEYMASADGRHELARAIASGIEDYKAEVDRARAKVRRPDADAAPAKPTPAKSTKDKKGKKDKKEKDEKKDDKKEKPQAAVTPAASDDTELFRIQILTSPRPVTKAQLKGLNDATHYRQGGTYKYTVGAYATRAEAERALPDIRKKFGDAFIIKMKGDRRLE